MLMMHIDGRETKPAMCVLAIIEESKKTSTFFYFATYPFMIKHNLA